MLKALKLLAKELMSYDNHALSKALKRQARWIQRPCVNFGALCLSPVKAYSAAQIKRIRETNKASQAVFAAYLNTSLSTVQKWERCQKKPNGILLKLLSLVDQKGIEVLL